MNKKRKSSRSKPSQPLYEKMIQDRDVMVPMRDGVRLCVDIYRPDRPEKFPAILGALRGRLLDFLITDEKTAENLLVES